MTEPVSVGDWVIVGATLPDGRVRLMASTKLTGSELIAEYDRFLSPVNLSRVSLTREFRLVVKMETFVIVDAPTYEAAFRDLFTEWSPEQANDRAAVGGRPRELES